MTRSATNLQVSLAAETIHLGPLSVAFLISAENAGSSNAKFEQKVPSAQR
jgi:hypothetical protein